MNSPTQQSNEVFKEIQVFAHHLNVERLVAAFQEMKSLGAQAMLAGHLEAVGQLYGMIQSLHENVPTDSQAKDLYLSAYLQEFAPSLEIVLLMDNPSLAVFELCVDTLTRHDSWRITQSLRLFSRKIARAEHYEILSQIIDSALGKLSPDCKRFDSPESVSVAKLMASVCDVVNWKSPAVAPLVKVLGKHSTLINELIANASTEAQDYWENCPNSDILRTLQEAGHHELTRRLYCEYSMQEVNDELTSYLCENGMEIDFMLYAVDYLERTHDPEIRLAAYNAIRMHVCTDGKFPLMVNFSKFNGVKVGEYINKQCQDYGAKYPSVCLDLAHKYLDATPEGAGLFIRPLPKLMVEMSDRLSEQMLQNDLGM
jgi:hypothetical protein